VAGAAISTSSATRRPSGKKYTGKVAISGCWSAVPHGEERFFVYGPQIGRMYLLSGAQLSNPHLLRFLGLDNLARQSDLADPAERIAHDRVSLRDDASDCPPFSLRLGYRIAMRTRGLIPLIFSVTIIRWLARRPKHPRPATISEIGRMVHRIERAVGIEECYPRALMTCYLCLRSGRACDLTVGALSPTPMMHIWCATEGLLPYEALPEHFMYQPLVTLAVAAAKRTSRLIVSHD
jgi:Transglutaminase-like superfamily